MGMQPLTFDFYPNVKICEHGERRASESHQNKGVGEEDMHGPRPHA